MTLRRRLLKLVLSVVIPALLASGLTAYFVYAGERDRAQQNLLSTSRAAALIVDRDLAKLVYMMEGLASSPLLTAGDYRSFDAQARETVREDGTWVVLSDLSGQQRVNTLLPADSPLPRSPLLDFIRQVAESRRPLVSDLFQGPVSGRPTFAVTVPIIRGGKVLYSLSMGVLPRRMGEILESLKLPPSWVATITDRQGIVVSRTLNAERTVGKPAAAELRDHMKSSPEGLFDTRTLEGTSVLAAYSRTPVHGWHFAVGVPRSEIEGPIRRSIIIGLGIGLIVLVMGGMISFLFARRISAPIVSLIEPALALGEGRAIRLAPTGLYEVDEVARALEQAQKTLLASEGRFRDVVAACPFPLLLHREDGRIIAMSQGWTASSGYTTADIPTIAAWTEKAYGARKDEVRAYIDCLYELKSWADEGEYSVRTADGGTRIWAFRSAPVGRDEQGLRLVVSMAADVTERAEADRALRAAKARAEEILASITDGFYAIDADWCFSYINQRAREILGRMEQEVVGRHFFEVFPQVLDTDIDRAYRRVMTTRRSERFEAVSPILRRWISFSVYPAGDGGISVYFRDISAEKAAQDQLIAAKAEAERANKAKSHFLAAASHDLRQPTQSLFFFHDILAARLRHHPVAPVLDNMRAGLEALKALLDGLLDISKLHAGTIEAQPSSFPVNEIFDRLKAEYIPRAAGKGLAFRVVPSSLWLVSDATLLERVIRNLVDNAFKYTAHGAILLGCRRRGDDVRIDVVDSGPGIPQDRLEDIWQEFVQLDNPERDRSKGLGLGLAIVRQACQLLGHEVTVRSKSGRGTMFSVTVPRALPLPVAAGAEEAQPISNRMP